MKEKRKYSTCLKARRRKYFEKEKRLMTLAKGEQVIKGWNYAASKQKGGEKKSASLIVTDKRIISEIKGSRSVSRQEIPLQAVKSIDMANSSPSKVGPIIAMIFGALLVIVGLIMTGKLGNQGYFAFLPILLGVLMVIAAILKLMRMAFVLVISTEGTEGTPLAIGASSWTQKRKTKSGKIKVRVNRASVLEIFDSLGAIVFTYKNER